MAKVGFWLAFDERENPSLEVLESVNGHIDMLSRQLETATLLPNGRDIIPFALVQKIHSFLNYESKVVQIMKDELKQNGRIFEDSYKRWRIINQGWRDMFRLLQEENNKTDPFRRYFSKKVWQKIWSDASAVLDKVEPLPGQ